MTASINIKNKTAKERTIETRAEGAVPEKPDEPIDYSEMLEPVDDEDRSKRKGRGPSPHYQGLIKAFLEQTGSSGMDEYKVNLDKFRAAIGKKDLPVASIRQGLRNNLLKTPGDDGRPLWETIQVSVDNRTGILTLKKREPKARKD